MKDRFNRNAHWLPEIPCCGIPEPVFMGMGTAVQNSMARLRSLLEDAGFTCITISQPDPHPILEIKAKLAKVARCSEHGKILDRIKAITQHIGIVVEDGFCGRIEGRMIYAGVMLEDLCQLNTMQMITIRECLSKAMDLLEIAHFDSVFKRLCSLRMTWWTEPELLLAGQTAYAIASRTGKKVLLLTNGVSADRLLANMVCLYSGFEITSVMTGCLAEDDFPAISGVVQKIAKTHITIVEENLLTGIPVKVGGMDYVVLPRGNSSQRMFKVLTSALARTGARVVICKLDASE